MKRKVLVPATQPLLDDARVAPEQHRRQTGRGRHVADGQLEHLPHESLARPVGHGDSAAAPGDAQQLVSRPVRVRGEHRAEHGDDGIEAAVGKRQCLRVAFARVHGEAFRGSPGRELRHEVWRDVDARGVRSRARRRQRQVAGAARDVEQALARRELEPLDKCRGAGFESDRDSPEVARGPGGTHSRA